MIFAELQKDSHQIQNEYHKCRSHISEETNKWRIYADHNIRVYQGYVEKYLGEAISAYRTGSVGLNKVINVTMENDVIRYSLEAMKHELTEFEAQKNKFANANDILSKEMTALENEREQLSKELQNTMMELEDAAVALELRDVERGECDRHHRALISCEQSLNNAAQQDKGNNNEQSSLRIKQLSDQIQSLHDQGKRKETMLEDMGLAITNSKGEIQHWKMKAESLAEKINFRNRRDVLKQYGPGPYYARINVSLSSSDVGEIVLKLAPLDLMSHTIHTFLTLIDEKMYVGGTFLLARHHILVAAPIDAFDNENNQRLEKMMLEEGYYPNGALLFHQYTPNFQHEKYTVGFSSGGGPLFYINIENNVEAHGPRYVENEGDVEGDPVFAEVVEGFDVIEKILSLPRLSDDSLGTRIEITDSQVIGNK